MEFWPDLLVGKNGRRARFLRPRHVKQNPAAMAAFRAGLEQNLEKLNPPKDRAVKTWGRMKRGRS